MADRAELQRESSIAVLHEALRRGVGHESEADKAARHEREALENARLSINKLVRGNIDLGQRVFLLWESLGRQISIEECHKRVLYSSSAALAGKPS